LDKKRVLFILSLAVLIVVLIGGVRFMGSFKALQDRSSWAQCLRDASREDGVNYLLYGMDGSNEETNVEEMFFINFSSSEASPHIIFIPGDILLHRQNEVEEPSLEETDYKQDYRPFYTPSHFYNEQGAELLVEQISFLLGTPVHHYIEIDYAGITAMVDCLGTVKYKGFALKGSDYLDYFLEGESAEEPLEKALRRTHSLKDIVESLEEKKGPFSLARTIRQAAPYFKTDLSWKELKAFYKDLEPLFDPQYSIVQLPGEWRDINGALFYEPDYVHIAAVMENLGDEFILPRELITVQVLNGSGVAGIASQVGDLLEEEGFQIIKVDNADSFDYQHSQVISHLEHIEPAREIALLVPGSEFFKEPLPDQDVMVTVIIGKNFSNLKD